MIYEGISIIICIPSMIVATLTRFIIMHTPHSIEYRYTILLYIGRSKFVLFSIQDVLY